MVLKKILISNTNARMQYKAFDFQSAVCNRVF